MIMAVSIRMARQGAKKKPQFLIVAMDENKKRQGAYLERLGYYYPKAAKLEEKVKLNLEAYNSWIQKGAQASETVAQLAQTAKKFTK